MKFESKYKHIQNSRKCIWKCCLQNVSHFVQTSMCGAWKICLKDACKVMFWNFKTSLMNFAVSYFYKFLYSLILWMIILVFHSRILLIQFEKKWVNMKYVKFKKHNIIHWFKTVIVTNGRLKSVDTQLIFQSFTAKILIENLLSYLHLNFTVLVVNYGVFNTTVLEIP